MAFIFALRIVDEGEETFPGGRNSVSQRFAIQSKALAYLMLRLHGKRNRFA